MTKAQILALLEPLRTLRDQDPANPSARPDAYLMHPATWAAVIEYHEATTWANSLARLLHPLDIQHKTAFGTPVLLRLDMPEGEVRARSNAHSRAGASASARNDEANTPSGRQVP